MKPPLRTPHPSLSTPHSSLLTPHSPLRIGTRASKLALTQTQWVADALVAAHPGLTCELVHITTSGDRQRTQPLPQIGGKGLFTKELEEALLRGDVDLAVHSLKDLPTQLPDGLVVAAVPARAPANDALIVRGQRTDDRGQTADGRRQTAEDGGQRTEDRRQTTDDRGNMEEERGADLLSSAICSLSSDGRVPRLGGPLALLPHGARIGTSSPRRAAQLRLARPDLAAVPMRGNLDTRLRKLAEGQADAIVLALAGLVRLSAVICPLSSDLLIEALPFELMLPAPGQGALAIEARAGSEAAALALAVSDAAATAATAAERALLDALGGGCSMPLGAYAELAEAQEEDRGRGRGTRTRTRTRTIGSEGGILRLRAVLLPPDGSSARRADRTGPACDPEGLGRAVAHDLSQPS
ncbi:MAG: hydroxymethylbilane synthase [Planctomycetes bacterium]|nr:hydroxymethylbilane synthase [Planctomycetota bacterium]